MLKSVKRQILGLVLSIGTFAFALPAQSEPKLTKLVDTVIPQSESSASPGQSNSVQNLLPVLPMPKSLSTNAIQALGTADQVAIGLGEYARLIGERYAAFHAQRMVRRNPASAKAQAAEVVDEINPIYNPARNHPKQFAGLNELNFLTVEEHLVRGVIRQIFESLPQDLGREVVGKVQSIVVTPNGTVPIAHHYDDAEDFLVEIYRKSYRQEARLQVIRLTGVPESMISELIQRHSTFAYILTTFTNEFFVAIQNPYRLSALTRATLNVAYLRSWSFDSIQSAIIENAGQGPSGTVSLSERWTDFLKDAVKLAAADGVSEDAFRKLVRFNAEWFNHALTTSVVPSKLASAEPDYLSTEAGRREAIALIANSQALDDRAMVPELTAYQAPIPLQSGTENEERVIAAYDALMDGFTSVQRAGKVFCRAFADGK